MARPLDPESQRLEEDAKRERNWKRWGPYLSDRQWGTVREDYSADGSAWTYFPHEHARSRAYRWGEDGLFGLTDRQCRLCFAIALWNGRDPILKERLFGLSGPEGNHGEDVKECYYHLDATPTSSYTRALYKYPQEEFPYARLVEENRRRTRLEPEFELLDTGVFDENRYFDVTVEYAKAAPEDVLIRITVENRASEPAEITLLPTSWARNTWSWGGSGEESGPPPMLEREDDATIRIDDPTLGRFWLAIEPGEGELVFTRNETNAERVFGTPNAGACFKDAFHDYVVGGDRGAVSASPRGTKAAFVRRKVVAARGRAVLRLRLCAGELPARPFGPAFEETFAKRIDEADRFYAARIPEAVTDEERRVVRQAYAGLLWTKQFYHYVVETWLDGDPGQPPPPEQRKQSRNADWKHLYSRDVISMPDKWEYPWFAAWDLAFHMLPMARIDPEFAKHQLELLLREWYMHPNGQIPAYEWSFSDVNPPVHAWAVWRVYKKTGPHGGRDRRFLASCFQKLLLDFTWWVNRKDSSGKHIFSGGFLGLDNIGVFDRSAPLPLGGSLEQADGTAWMAFYCGTMLSMALELAREDSSYEDMASKFFEHYVAIIDAINHLGGTGLWNEEDGFYYDQIRLEGDRSIPLRVRSMVGLLPLIAVEILEGELVASLPGFSKRLRWFLEHRPGLARHVSISREGGSGNAHGLLAIAPRDRLQRVVECLLDEQEFLSPYGLRSVSRIHAENPFVLRQGGAEYRVDYAPGESTTALFGGNSNWRGPIWLPVNGLLVEALERYHHFYGDSLRVEFPKGSGKTITLGEAAREIARRITRIFLPDAEGRRPCHGDDERYARDPHWKDLVLFYEYFHGDDGRGIGASHQTGWTALAATLIESLARERRDPGAALPADRGPLQPHRV